MFESVGLRSTRGKAVIVAAAVAMLSTAMTVPASADDSHTQNADVEVDSIAAEVPGLAEFLDATDATVADGVDVHANGDTAVVYDSGEGTVEIPDDPTTGVTLTSSTGSTVNIGLPGSPDDAEVSSNGSVVYNNAYRDTSIVVQPQIDGGARIITVLDSPAAPDSFDYKVTLDAGQSMSLTSDGGAAVAGQPGATILTVPAPWAVDANGKPVATDYTLIGTTLTLNVHPTDTTAYPIIADPCFWGSGCLVGWSIRLLVVTTCTVGVIGFTGGIGTPGVVGCSVAGRAAQFAANKYVGCKSTWWKPTTWGC